MMYLNSNEDRARYAIAMLWVFIIFNTLTAYFVYHRYQLASDYLYGNNISRSEVWENSYTEVSVNILTIIAFVISAITFIQWFQRAYHNLHQRLDNLSLKEGWATGAWFVPLFNLYLPFLIMKELFVETKKIMKRHHVKEGYSLDASLVVVWWALWIGISLTSVLGVFYGMEFSGIEELKDYLTFELIVDLAKIPVALLAIKLVSDYSKVEKILRNLPEDAELEELNQNKKVAKKVNLKYNEDRAKYAKVMLCLMLVIHAIEFGFYDLKRSIRIESFLSGGDVAVSEFLRAYTGERILFYVSVAAFVFTAIAFIQWFRRAFYNLNQVSDELENSESMAITSWFIPILNLFKPYQMMKELFLQSKRVIENQVPNKVVKTNVAYVNVWWILGLVVVLIRLYLKIFNSYHTLKELSNLIRVDMLFDLMRILTAIFAIKMLSDYSKIEKVLKQLFDGAEEQSINQYNN